jgi:two-component system, LuxR family, sensor kinase FixL
MSAPLEESSWHLLEYVPDATMIVDREGRILFVNAMAEKMFGYGRGELIGQAMEILIPQRFRERHVHHRKEYAHGPRSRPMGAGLDLYGVRKDGTEFPTEISLSPLRTEDGVQVMAAIRDVTEQKFARELAERGRLEEGILAATEEERRRLGRDLHDDIGQSLLGLALMTKLLEERLNRKGLPEASVAAEIVRRTNEAIQKTRDLSRGLFPIMVQTGGLSAALQELAENVEKQSGVRCVVKAAEEGLDSGFFKDEQSSLQLYRIAQEALNNAVRHGKPRNVTLKLLTDEDVLELVVEDDGVGITEAARGLTGMGLKVMRYRAERIGAALDVRRRPEGGTSVECRLARPNRDQ